MKEEENEPVFEIFDLKEGQTRSLPVVDGTFANFRHYSGVPIVIHGGVRIGALFVFRDKPAQQGLSRSHRHFMHETARQVRY
jgi:GAF domain-containing protein